MMKKLVSIIIPIYGVEDYLERCLKSLKDQTYHEIEILMIDDGSKDKSCEIAKRYAEIDNRFKYYYKDNGGLSSARNYGLARAKGEFVCFLDSDDFAHVELMASLIKVQEITDADYVKANYSRCAELNPKFKFPKYKLSYVTQTPLQFSQLNLMRNTLAYCVVWGCLFKRELLSNMQFDEEVLYGEDTKFNIDYVARCKTCAFIPYPLIGYTYRKTSATKSRFNERKLTALKAYEELLIQEKDNADLIDYVHLANFYQLIELLYLMYKSNYSNAEIVFQMIDKMRQSAYAVRKIKAVTVFRKCFAPFGMKLLVWCYKRKLRSLNWENYQSK